MKKKEGRPMRALKMKINIYRRGINLAKAVGGMSARLQ
jgi:hypothetical protein